MRAVSGRSVPILAFAAAGAAALIRLLGLESIGGLGDFGARTDAEAARIEMRLVKRYIFLCRISRWTNWSCIQRYIDLQKGNSFGLLAFLQCTTTNPSRRRYDIFGLNEPILNDSKKIYLPFDKPARPITRRGCVYAWNFSVVNISFISAQLLQGMWCVNAIYLLRLRNCVIGCI